MWQEEYKRKITTARDALRVVESGMRVYIHANSAFPQVLVDALTERAPYVRDVEVVHLLCDGRPSYADPGLEKSFRHNAIFMGSNIRKAVAEGRADCVPIHLSEIEGLFTSGQMPLDVALIQVCPPDAHGFVSLGVAVETTLTAAKCARYVIAQVNDQMPRTFGNTFLHVSEIDAFVEASMPLPDHEKPEITDVHRAIAKNCASLIEDGSTLQTGIGGIPDAILPYLTDRRDLGIHTELLSDGAIPLIEAGVINCRRKTFHPNKVIAGFLVGTKKIYQFAHNNPLFEFHPNAYVNDPFNIAKNDNMVAINSAVEVDLTGQVCSDSVGQHFLSGFGGQVDFIYGASRSKGGKPIIALPSTAKNDTVSKIVPMLQPGAGVVTSRALVHYVVTEFGIAYLHGRNVRQRAEALIQIAHPKFRNELYEHCERMKWLQKPQVAVAATAK
ncbi:MAG TPA: acetyl-CoA hydrolase/transferase C-terminal domain-containing protein [Terriglobales bacterium]|nr:acetyl-CoA hydrolase/transferase C-terminal domain-containing protein [Terriglobales bacterium]